MSTIVLRSVKGSPLTNAEVDSNFTNLNNDKTELGGTYSSGTANGVLFLSASKVLTTGSALTFDGTNLGVGTAAPGVKLDLVQTGASSGGALLRVYNATDGVGAGQIQIAKFGSSASYGPYSANTVGVNASGTNLLFGTESNHPVIFYQNNAEQMRLTSTGLGIGTSSPDTKFDVRGNAQVRNADNTQTTLSLLNGTSYNSSTLTNFVIGAQNSSSVDGGRTYQFNVGISGTALGKSLTFSTVDTSNGTTERMRLDSSGNLGLGVTPSAWATLKGLQVGNASVAGFGNFAYLNSNAFYDGSDWKYISNGPAGKYDQVNSIHAWYTSASGTAGNAISFTQAMTLTAGPELLVNCTSTPSSTVSGVQIANPLGTATKFSVGNLNSGVAHIQFLNGNGVVGLISTDGSATAYNTSSDYRLKNITGSITTSGAYIDSLNPVEGTWKADGSTFVGLIAHEVQEASRTNVATGVKDGEEMQGMDYSSAELIANMLAELKSLRARVAALESI